MVRMVVISNVQTFMLTDKTRSLHTCDCAFAGISCGQGSDTIWGVWDLITTILDENSITASHVRHIGHKVRPILIIPNVSLL